MSPQLHTRAEQLAAFDRLLTVMDDLREKCPWDRKQTFESLRQNTIEEVYELAAAIVKNDKTEISKELGDVLLHVVFYAKLGGETGDFDIADVCNRLCDKLIFRHPHVYGEAAAKNAEEVSHLWEQVKLKEKGGNKTVLEGVPEALPALVKAYRIQEKAANAGFDWEQPADVWAKVKEEIAEFEAELTARDASSATPAPDQTNSAADQTNSATPKTNAAADQSNGAADKVTQEFGDVLFSLVNAARLYKIRPDNALEMTNQKFIRRFNYIEQKATEQGRKLQDLTLEEMEALWQQAKTTESEKTL